MSDFWDKVKGLAPLRFRIPPERRAMSVLADIEASESPAGWLEECRELVDAVAKERDDAEAKLGIAIEALEGYASQKPGQVYSPAPAPARRALALIRSKPA